MEIRFADPDLELLYTQAGYSGKWGAALVSAYRNKVGIIESALDERDFYGLRSLRFEKLKGKRSHQHSIRINDQWRLVIEFEGRGADKIVTIVSIEDYH
jgi:proteic killer suppression protein